MDAETAELKESFKASLRKSKQSSIQSQQVSEKFSVPGFARESHVANMFDVYENRLAQLEDTNSNTVMSL